MRFSLQCRVLQWIYDYLFSPGIEIQSSLVSDCQKLCARLDALFPTLGLLRHPNKGVWGDGSTRLEHLGIVIDTVQFQFFVTEEKLSKLHIKSLTCYERIQSPDDGFEKINCVLSPA